MARGKTKKRNVYFTKETEQAIVRYNNEPDPAIRSIIFEREIYYAFFKLTQNIIHKFKFYYTDIENLEDLQHEVICFLLEKMHLFDPSKGAKAYSYFGTITKRYLILYNQKNYKKLITSDNIRDIKQKETTPRQFVQNIDEDKIVNSNLDYSEELKYFIGEYILYYDENLTTLFPNTEHQRIADCILELFRKCNDIELFNKKAIYHYLREMLGDVPTSKITRVARQMGAHFKEAYSHYYLTANIKFDL